MNKDLYIQLLEDKVRDQEFGIDVVKFTSKFTKEELKAKLQKSQDDFFNLGDICQLRFHELASKHQAHLESDQKMDTLVAAFKKAADQKIAELEDIVFELGDDCQDHEKTVATFDDLREDLACEILSLQNEIRKVEATNHRINKRLAKYQARYGMDPEVRIMDERLVVIGLEEEQELENE
ncbi:hypothetical protein [Acetobacterium sp.]|uniref:hypothetical protein n=1 Tax=Acetobacterium sp. TaxID=1872094 RepID=UPI002F3EB466